MGDILVLILVIGGIYAVVKKAIHNSNQIEFLEKQVKDLKEENYDLKERLWSRNNTD